ncbi:MAG: rubrerythrin, partial [Candidatus Latescibacteria bacterium]|nr:rubrerythrin [Candidatus Latescibacterota bacterium]
VAFSPDMSYQDALILAMKREEEAHQLYSDMGAWTNDPELEKMFAMLAQEEAKHKLRLETEYDEYVLAEN